MKNHTTGVSSVVLAVQLGVLTLVLGCRAHAPERRADDAAGSDLSYLDPLSEAGQAARGVYISGPYVKRFGASGLGALLRIAGLDSAVIDLKDGRGRITYPTSIGILAPQVEKHIGDPAGFVRDLHARGIYLIARIVCFADPAIATAHPERAILDGRRGREGTVWRSWGTSGAWLDPYNTDNHDLLVELAREAAELGFDEVLLDYIRFPVDDATRFAVYPADDGRPRWQVLLELLRRIDAAIDIPLGVAVFGLTAFRKADPGSVAALGQSLERWLPHVEVISPMLYLNAMKSWGRGTEGRAYWLIRRGLLDLRARLGPAPVIRPFLQGFADDVEAFEPAFIADQIRGAREGLADGFLFWNPASGYGMVVRALRGPARGLSPFPTGKRASARAELWGASDATEGTASKKSLAGSR